MNLQIVNFSKEDIATEILYIREIKEIGYLYGQIINIPAKEPVYKINLIQVYIYTIF